MLSTSIEKSKLTYTQLYEKLKELNARSDSEFKNLMDIGQKVPSSMSEDLKHELERILIQIYDKIEVQRVELENIKESINSFEQWGNEEIIRVGNVKGVDLLQRNTFENNMIEQLRILREGVLSVFGVISNLKKMIEDIKGIAGIENQEFKSMKNKMYMFVKDEVSKLKQAISNFDVSYLEEDLVKLKNQYREEIENLRNEAEFMKAMVKSANEHIKKTRESNMEILDKVNDEVLKLKVEYGNRLNRLENNVADSKNIIRY